MQYEKAPLFLGPTSIRDACGLITLDDLPDPEPENPVRLRHTTPLMARLWRIALADVEKNMVTSENRRYLGAGADFGVTVYTRDISYSGMLGLNRLCPQLVLDSLRFSRQVRRRMAFKVSVGHEVPEIPVPWEIAGEYEEDLRKTFHTNSYTRRTDDVIWLWCAADLLAREGRSGEWQWLYDVGNEFFRDFYAPFFDAVDGMYRGQASFVDIHFPGKKATGYPKEWEVRDCVLAKALSTNCLYLLGMRAMETAAARLNLTAEAHEWCTKASALKTAIRGNLRREDGTLAYLKDKDGNLQERRDALGTALAVIAEVVTGAEALQAIDGYPITDAGVPLFHPFFPEDDFYHNHSAWPFVDALFIRAAGKADGEDRRAMLAALLARTCVGDGTFHEVVDLRDKRPKGSGSQLWTAAAFIGLCYDSGLVDPTA